MDYDVLIVGGGMVGASLACALRDSPLRVALVEAVAPDAERQPSYDARAIALALGSLHTLEAMGVRAHLADAVTAIGTVHISDRGHFGAARIRAAEEGVEALGGVVEARALGDALHAGLEEASNIARLCPARVEGVATGADSATVTVDQDGDRRVLEVALVVAADGGRSELRRQARVRSIGRSYRQHAVIANVATDRPHGGVAYERFTDSGPLALLPFTGGEAGERRWGLVWTCRDAERDALLELDDTTFLSRLQARFGHRAGTFLEAGPRGAYPLELRAVPGFVQRREVFVGNAAHVVHPVAGQGFNLGLRDAAVLARVLREAADGDVGAPAVLKGYARARRPDYLTVAGTTDGFVRLFTSTLPPVVAARNLGLIGLDLLRPLKRGLARRLMGRGA